MNKTDAKGNLRCGCGRECSLRDGDNGFIYILPGGLETFDRLTYYANQPKLEAPTPINYDAMDAEVQASGFIRKPACNEFYIVFEEPLTELQRLQVAAAVFSALYVAFPNSHIGDYKGMI